jgi:hypothetical protein
VDKVAKLILNSLKCPVCGGQIDMIHSYISKKGNNFSCVYDPIHYALNFAYEMVVPKILHETVSIYDESHLYDIKQTHFIGQPPYCIPQPRTTISIRNVDKENRIIDSGIFKTFAYNKLLFDFPKTNKVQIIKRVKTILVFQ